MRTREWHARNDADTSTDRRTEVKATTEGLDPFAHAADAAAAARHTKIATNAVIGNFGNDSLLLPGQGLDLQNDCGCASAGRARNIG